MTRLDDSAPFGGALGYPSHMAISIVRLGSPRGKGEGLRLGTVRRPPRGVPKSDFAKRDYYDIWLPQLAPSDSLLRRAQSAETPAQWRAFERAYRSEMREADNARLLDFLAALSASTALAVGCYCEDETRCHRSILRDLLRERRAKLR